MKKYLLVLVLAVCLTAVLTYRVTMRSLRIETDGYGDSAIVTVFGQSDLYGINGHTVD